MSEIEQEKHMKRETHDNTIYIKISWLSKKNTLKPFLNKVYSFSQTIKYNLTYNQLSVKMSLMA